MKQTKVLLLAICWLGALPFSKAMAQAADNIALGKSVTFNPAPNYTDCADPDDDKQLTDGQYSSQGQLQEVDHSRAIWVQKGTVGWQNVKPVVITVDLGSVQPISGVSYSTAGGTAGVTWPTAIYMAVSDDGKNWYALGDLAVLSRKNGKPPAQGYAAFRYVTHDLQARGRYLSFAAVATPFVFVDEIEIFKGDDAWPDQATRGGAISSIADYANQSLITSAAQRRLYDDIDAVREEMKNTPLTVARKSTLTARLDQDAAATARMSRLGVDFKTILPLDPLHQDILAVRGALLAARGLAPLTVWKMHRYAWLPFFAVPSQQEPARLHFSMLRDQFRSDALLFTNATDKSQTLTLRLNNTPPGTQPGWLQVYAVAWTDTSEGTPVADALIPVEEKNHTYSVDIPAGMTRKVWFTVDSSKVPAGEYKSTFEVKQHEPIPLTLRVSTVTMQPPRLSLCMWDDSNGKGSYGITPQNRAAAIALMRSHFVDTPCANRLVLPWPDANAFDAQGNLKQEPDFSNLDEWIAQWPGARRYFVFANVPAYFAGAKMDTPEFAARAGSWAKVLSQHLQKLHLQPRQLTLLLVDEPYRESQDAVIAAWAGAINAAAPELTLFSDPRWQRPDQTKIQDALTGMDILCPALPTYNNGGKTVQKYFQEMRTGGRELWFYQTNGPAWRMDPQLYYRYQPWHAFAAGGTGQGFWSFGDIGKAPTSWNGYSNTVITYAPAYLDRDAVFDSIHWDAVREGMEDYEELAMLRDAIAASRDAAWKTRAQQILDSAVKAVTGVWNTAHYATGEGDPYLADTQLQKVREMLNSSTHDK
jgi:hypothetical protein